jgi:nucleoside-diphosphate-sugar epimerase
MKKILDCNMSEKLNVLVTGSAGFIGTNLIEKLKDFGHTIADITKLRKIGYGNIFTSLEDGARKTWEFYKDKKHRFNGNK